MLTVEMLRQLLSLDVATGKFTWLVDRGRMAKAGDAAGSDNGDGYVRIGICGRQYLAHRLAWFYVNGKWPDGHTDHKFGEKADNRPTNLREVTRSGNQQNQRRARCDNQTGLLGVSPYRDKFMAQIHINGKRKYLGLFDRAGDAHLAYLQAKRSMHATCTI